MDHWQKTPQVFFFVFFQNRKMKLGKQLFLHALCFLKNSKKREKVHLPQKYIYFFKTISFFFFLSLTVAYCIEIEKNIDPSICENWKMYENSKNVVLNGDFQILTDSCHSK